MNLIFLKFDLYKILKSSEEHLIKSVKSGVPFINFDIAIDEWRRSEEGSRFFNNSNKLIDTKFITNASDPEDAGLSMFKVLTHYPDTIILHHKTNSDNFSFTSKASLDTIDYLDPKIELIKKYSKPSLSKLNIPIFFHIRSIISLIVFSLRSGNAIKIFFLAIIFFLNNGPKYFPIISPKSEDNLRPMILNTKKKKITSINSRKYLKIFIKIIF